LNRNIKIMKKEALITRIIIPIIMLSVVAVLIAGCGFPGREIIPEETGEQQEPAGEEAEEEEEPAIEIPPAGIDKSEEIENEFNLIDKSVENIEVIFNFIDENIADSDPELASDMVHAVINLCEDYRPVFVDKFSDPEVTGTIYALSSEVITDGELNLEALRDTENEKVKNVAEEAINKKYKLIMIEGMIEPIVDYGAYDVYIPYLSAEMKDYLDIKIDESEKPAVMDAEVTIPADEFIGRILKSMDYLKNYPDSSKYDEISQLKGWKMWIYLGGIDNSPVFGPDGKILPAKLNEFEDMLARYSDTGFGEILASYLELLEQENYIRTERVKEFLDDLYKI